MEDDLDVRKGQEDQRGVDDVVGRREQQMGNGAIRNEIAEWGKEASQL